MTFSRALALFAAAWLLIAAPIAFAADSTAPALQDTKIVQAAWNDWATSQDAGLSPHLPALQEVLARAPASYPMIERKGDATIVRAIEESEALMLGITSAASDTPKNASITIDANTYGRASFLLGWHYNHARQPDEALKALDHGLAFQPGNGALVSEKGIALAVQGRFTDALALYDDWFENGQGGAASPHRARLLRAKGYALIELHRLNDAENAYRESLAIEPNHPTATRELAFIANQKSGKAGPVQTDVRVTTAGEAKNPDRP